MRQRQHNGERQTAARRLRGTDEALMRLHHRQRDGKAQSGSALGTRTRGIRGVEAFEQLRARLFRRSRPMVLESQHGVRGSGGHALPDFGRVEELPQRGVAGWQGGQRVLVDRGEHGAHRHAYRRIGWRVAVHVADDVRHHLAQSGGVADQTDRLQLPVLDFQRAGVFAVGRLEHHGAARDFAFGVERVQVVGRVRHQRGERHLLRHVDAAAFVQAREREQVFDEHGHALAGAFDVGDGFVGALQCPRQIALHGVQLRIPVDRGERRAQFVACVGDEALHFLGGLLLLVEAAFDAREHGVQRGGERADFRVFGRGRHALAQVAGRDLGGGFLDAFQRAQGAADDERGKRAAEQHDGDAYGDAVLGEGVDDVDLVG